MPSIFTQKLSLSIIQSIEKDLWTLGDLSVPILGEPEGSEPILLGTGWFLQLGAIWFLVTAEHVLRKLYPEDSDPTSTRNTWDIIVPGLDDQPIHLSGSTTMTPGRYDVDAEASTMSRGYDVGIVRLHNPKLVYDRWKPVRRMTFVPEEDFDHGCYFVAGWPEALSFPMRGGIATQRYQLLAPFARDQPFDRDIDIRLSLDRNDHSTLKGEPVAAPALAGMSGAPIWRVFKNGSSRYKPELAGILTAVGDGGDTWIIYGTRSGVLRNLVERETPGLYAASEKLILR